MPGLPQNQHTTTLTKMVAAAFEEDRMPLNGLGMFFPRQTVSSLFVDIQVSRDSDTIAVDVERFTEGNHNKVSRNSEKTYKPPFYHEIYDFTRDEVYMNSVTRGIFNNPEINRSIAETALKNMRKMRNKIERAILKQQMDVLQSGSLTLDNGDNISYRRKSTSMVDLGAGNYWDAAGADPIKNIEDGCKFLRDTGASSSNVVNLVMRDRALNEFLQNNIVKDTANFRRISRLEMSMPMFDNATGMGFHGVLAAGDFEIRVWTYNQSYTTTVGGARTFYLNENRAILLPEDFMGATIFGGLVGLRSMNIMGEQGMAPTLIETDYLMRSFFDMRTTSSGIELMSAPVVVPVTVDKIYTMQVFA